MKRKYIFVILIIIFSFSLFTTAFAVGDGNLDGGGGDMGSGTGENFWSSNDEGVRVTIIRASDKAVVTTPIDLTNKNPSGLGHFNKVCKIQYINGMNLTPSMTNYTYTNPTQSLPKIISTTGGNGNIAAIKDYFTDELVVKYIATSTGMNYDVLINGDYKLLLEPVAYLTYNGIMYAMTAHEAALYDEILGGDLRSKMGNLTHKNLPLAMFLETSDLSYPAWSGSRTASASNADIKSSLGLGIVRFTEVTTPAPTPTPSIETYDYEYRVNTEVITAVKVSGGQSDPNHTTTVKFKIGSTTYTVSNVYYPSGDSQLAWVRWTTPSTPQDMVIPVTVSGVGTAQSTINVKIVDLDKNPPPNPVADDRNDSFTYVGIPSNTQKTSLSWGVWSPRWHEYWVWISNWVWRGSGSRGRWVDRGYWRDDGWWDFDYNSYSASLTGGVTTTPDDKSPTAVGKTTKSGYGLNIKVTGNVSTNQSSAVTSPQTAVTYFPEFRYGTYWRLLERTTSGSNTVFEFRNNKYSTYNRRTHFTPIWMPDGNYTAYTYLQDVWTPAGMLSMNLTDTITIQGNLWSDWHIAPK